MFLRSQMISQEDYNFVVAFDVTDATKRERLLKSQRLQCAKTFLNLLGHVSRDQTLQYILVLVDDMLQVTGNVFPAMFEPHSLNLQFTSLDLNSESCKFRLWLYRQEDRGRVEIFHEYATETKESVWSPFLNLLNRQDGFITNMTARVIARIACWSHTPMERSDLHYYLTWLKDQLTTQVRFVSSLLRTTKLKRWRKLVLVWKCVGTWRDEFTCLGNSIRSGIISIIFIQIVKRCFEKLGVALVFK